MIKPFRLSPAFKDYIWGGSKLKTAYFKDTPFDKTAESWELSCHKNGESTVVGGEFHGQTLSAVISEFLNFRKTELILSEKTLRSSTVFQF